VIVCSLNEIQAYGQRAARGAGMSWGLAQEAGKATRWLAERGLPGVELLVGLLTANDKRSYASMAPVMADGHWRAGDGELCPVCSGAALCDRIDLLIRGEQIRMSALAYPLLLAPFLDQSSRSDASTYELCWQKARVLVCADSVTLEGESQSAFLVDFAGEVTVSISDCPEALPTHQFRVAGVKTSTAAWRAMDALAKRTYVPASEESRALGAGAGRIDND
jgi:hypothetical protein